MPEELRRWIHRHLSTLSCSLLIGMTLGISILALAYFSTRNDVAAEALRHGVRITGHSDIDEDMVWFFCGIVVGVSVTCLAWWRDNKVRSNDLEKADVEPSAYGSNAPDRSEAGKISAVTGLYTPCKQPAIPAPEGVLQAWCSVDYPRMLRSNNSGERSLTWRFSMVEVIS